VKNDLPQINHKHAERPRRDVAAEEEKQDQATEKLIEQRVRAWKRRTTWLGVTLGGSLVSIIPFLYGNPLHNYWDSVGRKLLLPAGCLLCAFLYAAGTTFNFSIYLRDLKKIHANFGPDPR
jgi:hypothetical protein